MIKTCKVCHGVIVPDGSGNQKDLPDHCGGDRCPAGAAKPEPKRPPKPRKP